MLKKDFISFSKLNATLIKYKIKEYCKFARLIVI